MSNNRKLGSFPSVLITFSLTIALFLIGFCGWLALTSKQLIRYVKQNVEVQAYLDKDITQIQSDSIRNIIASKNYVENQGNVPQIKFITKESIAKKFVSDTKENYKSVMNENPFRDAYTIKIKEEFFNETELQKIKEDLEQINGVFEVDYFKDFVTNISKNATNAYIIIATFVLILLVAIIILINNTIRLALYSQRFIIRSMQLVGATNGFIQKPFLTRSSLQGLLAGIIASICLFGLQQLALNKIEGLDLVQNYTELGILTITIIIIGILIGFLSTYQSINRYLKMDLDELY